VRLVTLAVVLSLIVGCCHQKPTAPPEAGRCVNVTKVWLDPLFNTEEREAFARAAGAWADATPECFVIIPNRADAQLTVRLAITREQLADEWPDWRTCAGLYQPTKKNIWLVSETYTLDQKATILAHELGHYFGLDHSQAFHQTSVMASDLQDDYPLTYGSKLPEADRAAYWSR